MRHTEFWSRLEGALGSHHYQHWAEQHVLTSLGSRTPVQALAEGIPPRQVWRAAWAALELSDHER